MGKSEETRSSATSTLLTDRAQLPDERRIFARPGLYGVGVVIAFVVLLLLVGAIFILPFAGK